MYNQTKSKEEIESVSQLITKQIKITTRRIYIYYCIKINADFLVPAF